jgi:Tol biopolymer transport system component
LCIVLVAWVAAPSLPVRAAPAGDGDPHKASRDKLRAVLKGLPHKIVFETFRDNNWELYAMDADGSNKVNLTKNPKAHELYPHASPDGTKICFVADEGKDRSKVRSVYVMNTDGTERTLVARNARQPCWGPNGRRIAYTRGEYERFTTSSYGTRGLFVYNLATRRHEQHANRSILHVCYLCWSPKGKWVFATVSGGMGYGHANLAIEAAGKRVDPIRRAWGCRIDVRPDGKKIAWNLDDQTIAVADVDLTSSPPKVSSLDIVLYCDWPEKVYHADWSPCGRYLAFSRGPAEGSQHVGESARNWQICVADASQENVWIPLTSDGVSNKEPDWVSVKAKGTK